MTHHDVCCSLERKLLDAQETSARRKRMKKESTEVSSSGPCLDPRVLVSSICTVSGDQAGENAAAPGQLCSPWGRGRGAGGGAGADTATGGGEVSRAVEQSATTDAFI